MRPARRSSRRKARDEEAGIPAVVGERISTISANHPSTGGANRKAQAELNAYFAHEQAAASVALGRAMWVLAAATTSWGDGGSRCRHSASRLTPVFPVAVWCRRPTAR